MMSTNQIGELDAGKLKTVRPAISADVDVHPGFKDKWGLGFRLTPPLIRADGRRAAWLGRASRIRSID